jgi:hypothetical protein
VPRGTQDPARAPRVFAYRALTSYGRPFQTVRLTLRVPPRGPSTPRSPRGSHGLGSSDFARHYSRNHSCFLFLRVLRWFTSPGSPPAPMYSAPDNRCSHRLGFPIRTSPDHSLFAAPRGFSQLTTSFFACLRLGIPTHALSSLTIKSTLNTLCPSALPTAAPFLPERPSATNLCFVMPVNIQLSKIRKPSASRFQPSALRSPFREPTAEGCFWWAWVELNYRPHPYQGCALAT